MKHFFFILFILFGLAAFGQTDNYFKGQIIVKVKPNYANKCNKSSIQLPIFQELESTKLVSTTEKIFPNHKSVKKDKSTSNYADLSTIYRMTFDKNIPPQKIINQLLKENYIEYAEPVYINQLAYTPNDTISYKQWYLNAIQAFDAWDIQKGDTNVVIAIVDTGSDMDHEDLEDNFAINYADPINGIDDDNDGFIDNYRGWDMANNDNDPEYSSSAHGTNVAGLASASTDNTVGISGPGFNCRLLTVRIDDQSTGQLTAAYEGLVYAADHGAFVINNSWGSYSYSNLAQDVINYAAINKGALVICAVGNGPFSGPNAGIGIDDRFYPAAYENVFSVGALDEGDTVKGSSNYGYWVDIFAPGGGMYTTTLNGTYAINGGTSMAAPVLSGVAALVKSEFPNYTAEQVKQKILNTAEDVSAVNDVKYTDKLGSGRVNAYLALTDTVSPGIAFKNKVITDQNDETYLIGDTIRIWGDFTNYLADAMNVSVNVKAIDNKLQLIDGNTNLGDITNLNSKNNQNDPFTFYVNQVSGYNEIVDFELSITATNYSIKRYFSIIINPGYITVNENNLTVSLPSNGRIGFSEANGNLGEGIKYLGGNSLLFEGGFILGSSANYIPNVFRGDSQSASDEDFQIEYSVRPVASTKSDFEALTIYNDANLSNPPKVKIEQRNYFFSSGINVNSVIYVYSIKNISDSSLSNLYAGLLLDWDIADYSKNKVHYDLGRKMGISYSTDTNLYCGVRALNDSLTNFHYAIDNQQSGNGGINIGDGFSDAEKYFAISNQRDSAGNTRPEGNDIVDVNSMGPFSIEKDSSILVAFSITVAESIANLEEESDSIALLFKQLSLNLNELVTVDKQVKSFIYPNPSNSAIHLDLNMLETDQVIISAYDIGGKLVYSDKKTLHKGKQRIELSVDSWKNGVYFLKIKGDRLNFQNTFVVAP